MSHDIQPLPTPLTIDLTGLPQETVQQVLSIVREARETQAERPVLRSPNQDDPERWSAEWRAFIASRPKGVVSFDDDRDSIYAGCGE